MAISLRSLVLTLAALTLLAGLALTTPVLAADADAGARDFKRRCAACHTIEAGERHRTGPNLAGLFSRQAGKAEGYRYSPGLAEADFTWDDERLDAWLEDPRKVIPKSKMVLKLRDAEQRANIIAYLREQLQ